MISAAGHSLAPDGLGQFTIGLGVVQSVLAVIRSLTGEVLLVESTNSNSGILRRARSRQSGSNSICASMMLAILGALVVAVASLAWSEMSDVLLIAALMLPAVVFQDAARYVLISRRESGRLLALDTALLVMACGSVWVGGFFKFAPAMLLVLWGISCLVIGVCSYFVNRLSVLSRGAWPWMRQNFRLSSSFAFESIMGATLGFLLLIILNNYAGPAEVAAYRASISVFGLVSLAVNFLKTAVLREISPAHVTGPRAVASTMIRMSGLIAFTVALAVVGVLVLPQEIGRVFFGQTWVLIVGLWLPAALHRLAAGLSTVPLILLRVQGVGWKSTGVRLVCIAVGLIAVPIACKSWGAIGALLSEAGLYLLVCVSLTVLSVSVGAARSNRRFSALASR